MRLISTKKIQKLAKKPQFFFPFFEKNSPCHENSQINKMITIMDCGWEKNGLSLVEYFIATLSFN